MAAGTASMIEQNWQKSSQPSIDSARSASWTASARLVAARIIVPNTRCSRCLATIEFRASGSARFSSRLASASSPWASRTSASRCSECASPAADPSSRCSVLASASSAAARSRSPDSSAASPDSARANAAARLDALGVAHGEIVDAGYGSGLSFRDPDNIALELFAPPA